MHATIIIILTYTSLATVIILLVHTAYTCIHSNQWEVIVGDNIPSCDRLNCVILDRGGMVVIPKYAVGPPFGKYNKSNRDVEFDLEVPNTSPSSYRRGVACTDVIWMSDVKLVESLILFTD